MSFVKVEDYAQEVCKKVVAHWIQLAGFTTVHMPVVLALTEITQRYIQRIGRTSKDLAEVAGRTQPNALDILMALEDMSPVAMGVDDLVQAIHAPAAAFANDIPAFPIKKAFTHHEQVEFKLGKAQPLPSYVPSHAPPFPSFHTYQSTKEAAIERNSDAKTNRFEKIQQKRLIQDSLNTISNVKQANTLAVEESEERSSKRVKFNDLEKLENPFLAPPAILKSDGSISKFNIVPNKAQGSKVIMSSATSSVPSSSKHDLGKEERILNGTFHEGDSE